MSKIPKNNFNAEIEIPKMIELTENEVKKRFEAFNKSLKDEDGLIEAIKKNIDKMVTKDEFKRTE